jgi:hypothetical protein
MNCQRLAAIAALVAMPALAQAETFASATHTLLRGTVAGDMAGYYGGSLFGAFPVALDDATARAYVLGAPDSNFLSLPGEGGTPNGAPFPGAYVEVSFGADFGPYTVLNIWELGNNEEGAQVFLWTNNGGNIQLEITRAADDKISLDLSGYAGTLAGMGATSFTKVGIGGLDENGASKGFDLDAVSITAVPEPSTYALMLAGLAVVGWLGRRERRTAA